MKTAGFSVNLALMVNRVDIKESFLELTYFGDQDYQTITEMVDHCLKLVSAKRLAAFPLCLLVNLSYLGKSTPASRSATFNVLRKVNIASIAVVATSLFNRHLAELVLRAAGLRSRVRIFTDRFYAEAWLTRRRKCHSLYNDT